MAATPSGVTLSTDRVATPEQLAHIGKLASCVTPAHHRPLILPYYSSHAPIRRHAGIASVYSVCRSGWLYLSLRLSAWLPVHLSIRLLLRAASHRPLVLPHYPS
jgi:hypothetical protein